MTNKVTYDAMDLEDIMLILDDLTKLNIRTNDLTIPVRIGIENSEGGVVGYAQFSDTADGYVFVAERAE